MIFLAAVGIFGLVLLVYVLFAYIVGRAQKKTDPQKTLVAAGVEKVGKDWNFWRDVVGLYGCVLALISFVQSYDITTDFKCFDDQSLLIDFGGRVGVERVSLRLEVFFEFEQSGEKNKKGGKVETIEEMVEYKPGEPRPITSELSGGSSVLIDLKKKLPGTSEWLRQNYQRGPNEQYPFSVTRVRIAAGSNYQPAGMRGWFGPVDIKPGHSVECRDSK